MGPHRSCADAQFLAHFLVILLQIHALQNFLLGVRQSADLPVQLHQPAEYAAVDIDQVLTHGPLRIHHASP